VKESAPVHVAIIMDGNGRWATRRGLPRAAGHRAGAKTLTRVVEAAPSLGVTQLTVFAFSSDNWRRPAAEVDALMNLFRSYLCNESERHARKGTRLSIIGRRDRLSAALADEISRVEAETANGDRLHVRVAIDYSARDSISRVLAAASAPGGVDRETLGRLISQWPDEELGSPDVDLLIRTGGEKRLSDFLLWECAYAELAFLDVMWPEFTTTNLAGVIADFRRRERRFGGLAPTLAAATA
jgi:undecaprenyl diphosphate synthase